mmetsp:Transcript_115297/g.325812  ORF Transcript_115297/g.325812 Transcript_115297/m.325812 type:complete len:249 (-) Transcript_115297:375-1121(-)
MDGRVPDDAATRAVSGWRRCGAAAAARAGSPRGASWPARRRATAARVFVWVSSLEVCHPNAELLTLRGDGNKLFLVGTQPRILKSPPIHLDTIGRYREVVPRVQAQRVLRGADQRLLLRVKLDGLNGRRAELCGADWLECFEAPHVHGLVGGSGGHVKISRVEGDRCDRPSVQIEVPHQLSSGQVPNFHLAVLPAGGYPSPMGAEPDGSDGLRVTLVGLYAGFSPQVPDLHVRVRGSRREELPIWVAL